MANSNDVEDASARSSLLSTQPNRIGNPSQYKMSQAPRALKFGLAILNSLLFILGLATAGLAGSTIEWSKADSTPRFYNLIQTPENIATTPQYVAEFPTGFKLIGINLVLAAGITTTAVAVLGMAHAFGSKRQRHGQDTNKNKIPTRLVILLTSIVTIFSIVALGLTWNEFGRSPQFTFTNINVNTKSHLYTSSAQTPETWARHLSETISNVQYSNELQARYLIAAIARISLAPITLIQVIVLFGLIIFHTKSTSLMPTQTQAMQKAADTELQSIHAVEAQSKNGSTVTESTGLVGDDRSQAKVKAKPKGRMAKLGFKNPLTWVLTPHGGTGQFAHVARP